MESDNKAVFLCRYQYLYGDNEGEESAVCVDINECSTGTHACDINAICVNEPGSFACQCKAGYTGDGSQCESKDTYKICFLYMNTEVAFPSKTTLTAVVMNTISFQ